MITGIAISFASEPIYDYYATTRRLRGMSVLHDQMLGGILMWIPGSMMYLVAALVLIARMVRAEESRQPLLDTEWAADETESNHGKGDNPTVQAWRES
jgi:cytochrome c oxidase assembly factor CtaG